MKTLRDSPKYKTFTEERNRALEQINLNTQTDISRMLHDCLESITGFVSHLVIQENLDLHRMTSHVVQFQNYLTHLFYKASHQMTARLKMMRRATFYLTYLAELEGIARATQKTKPLSVYEFKLKLMKQMDQDTITGQSLEKQVWKNLTLLELKILQAFTRALALSSSPREIVEAVKKAYPPIVSYQKPPRALKRVQEADHPKEKKEFNFYFDLTNDEDWNLAVQAYQDTELPPGRFDQAAEYDPETGYSRYQWELEQDMTDDFVKQVRDGQVDAAKELGVEEFVWIAVIDNKTCDECCLPRNGKTTTEIEEMLASGDLDGDFCDAVSPPSHPNCRCDLSPIGNSDPVEGPDWKSFDEWLNT